jgi:hypothetical protein
VRLVNRTCAITIHRTERSITERRFFVTLPNVVTVRDQRISFGVKKSLSKTPNTCEVKIYNLAPLTRGEVEEDGVQVKVEAGYDGVTKLLFQGDVRSAFSETDGAHWVTTMHLADGGKAFGNARGNRSYRGGTRVITILRDLAKSFGLELPRDVLAAPELRTQFAAGYVLDGPVRDHLTTLLDRFGYSWSIQNGRLQVLRDDAVVAGTVREISEATGMLGSPAMDKPKKKGGRTVSVRNQLYPELAPGGAIVLKSLQINGQFKIKEVVHQGDTHDDGDDSWTTSVEAT